MVLRPVLRTTSLVKCLAQGYKRTFRLFHHTIPFKLNAKQESCEYQLFKYFNQIRRGSRNQVYRLRGGRFTRHTIEALIIFNSKTMQSIIQESQLFKHFNIGPRRRFGKYNLPASG